jgi:transcription antitermination factor NusG
MYKLSKQEHRHREELRGRYSGEQKWYGVMTHYGQERNVRDQILDVLPGERDEALLPELTLARQARNGRARGKLLFPCYVFLRCRMNDPTYIAVADCEGVVQILGLAYRIPYAIEDTEICHLRALLSSDPPPSMSQRLNIGAEAVVRQGIMEGLRGRIIEFNAQHVKLETCFSFLDSGTSIVVVVPKTDVEVEKNSNRLIQ